MQMLAVMLCEPRPSMPYPLLGQDIRAVRPGVASLPLGAPVILEVTFEVNN